jgi:hypothetical protein
MYTRENIGLCTLLPLLLFRNWLMNFPDNLTVINIFVSSAPAADYGLSGKIWF